MQLFIWFISSFKIPSNQFSFWTPPPLYHDVSSPLILRSSLQTILETNSPPLSVWKIRRLVGRCRRALLLGCCFPWAESATGRGEELMMVLWRNDLVVEVKLLRRWNRWRTFPTSDLRRNFEVATVLRICFSTLTRDWFIAWRTSNFFLTHTFNVQYDRIGMTLKGKRFGGTRT